MGNIKNEIFILVLYILLVILYIGNVDQKFIGDGKGYYDYLPSIFIHHDLLRKDFPLKEYPEVYERVGKMGVYVAYKDHMVNMYPCGTALLELPFFMLTYQISELKGTYADGYELPFQRTISAAALFYLLLSLIFLKKVLKTYHVRSGIIYFIQLLMVLATPVTIYANKEAGFSHIYSMFAITAFIYYIRSFFLYEKGRDFIAAAIFMSLIVILRQVNLMIILFVPFLSGSFKNLVKGIRRLLRNYRVLIPALICFLAVFSIQATMWFLQTGDFILYSYQGYGFNFLDPKFFKILFSYKKGLFVYTPVLFLALLSVAWLVKGKRYFEVFSWLGFFVLITYVLSSWFSWYYGASYGLRAYIDYFTVFFIPLAILLNESGRLLQRSIIVLSMLTIPLNVIQTEQYRHYILHNGNMDKERYWRVFLRTGKQFRGIFYVPNLNLEMYEELDSRMAGDYTLVPGKEEAIVTIRSSEINNFSELSLIQVSIENDFQKKVNARIGVLINNADGSENLYFVRIPLIHFAKEELNSLQTGTYNFPVDLIMDKGEKQVILYCYPGRHGTDLKNITIRFFRNK